MYPKDKFERSPFFQRQGRHADPFLQDYGGHEKSNIRLFAAYRSIQRTQRWHPKIDPCYSTRRLHYPVDRKYVDGSLNPTARRVDCAVNRAARKNEENAMMKDNHSF